MISTLKCCLNKYQPYVLYQYGSTVSLKHKMYLSCILSFYVWPVADVVLAHIIFGLVVIRKRCGNIWSTLSPIFIYDLLAAVQCHEAHDSLEQW
jgi:hypothetical protein